MEMPKASAAAVAQFEQLTPKGSDVTTRKVFGHPAAFVHGNMFFGVFGEDLFVRLSEGDAAAAREKLGFGPFEPMPGRAMTGYWVLPAKIRSSRTVASTWVAKALTHTSKLPAKVPKKRSAK